MDKKYLIIDSRPYGFFSIFLHTLDNIKWAVDNGYTPLVKWGPGRRDPHHGPWKDPNLLTDAAWPSNQNTQGHKHCLCLYHDGPGHNGSTYPWEYYFEQLPGGSIAEIENNNIPHDRSDIFLIENYIIGSIRNYSPLVVWSVLGRNDAKSLPGSHEHRHRTEINQLINQYVKVKQPILDKVNDFQKKHFQGYMIGVHIRGTDKRFESGRTITLDSYVRAVTELLQKTPDAKIFVASDNNQAILKMREAFGKDKVVFTTSTRMNAHMDLLPLHLSEAKGPLIGEQVLVETLLLSRCNHFVCTDSNVGAGIAYFNPDIPATFMNIYPGA